jgi:hypothetical protein
MGTHFSTRADLVFACFAVEMWKIYDFPPTWGKLSEGPLKNRVVIPPALQLVRNWVL